MKLLVLALAFAIPGSFAADTAADLQKKFVGSWRLVSIEGLNQIVKSKPSGIIMFDNTGHMSVQITLGDKPVFPALGAKATDHEKAAAFDNYIAYYGTYTFEPENGIVIHHLESSHVPSLIGQDNIRYFEFSDNRLTLSVANDGKGGRLARADSSAHVTWEKIPVNG